MTCSHVRRETDRKDSWYQSEVPPIRSFLFLLYQHTEGLVQMGVSWISIGKMLISRRTFVLVTFLSTIASQKSECRFSLVTWGCWRSERVSVKEITDGFVPCRVACPYRYLPLPLLQTDKLFCLRCVHFPRSSRSTNLGCPKEKKLWSGYAPAAVWNTIVPQKITLGAHLPN